MSEELFDKSKDNQIRQNGLIMNIDEVVDLLNSQSKLISAYMYEFAKMSKENKKLKEERDALQKKTEMDKNDFFISEAKRMTLLAFLGDKELQKEYSEWERRIWNE